MPRFSAESARPDGPEPRRRLGYRSAGAPPITRVAVSAHQRYLAFVGIFGRGTDKKSFDAWARTAVGASALVEGHNVSAAVTSARHAAASSDDDESARERLRQQLPSSPDAVHNALAHLGEVRVNYLEGRAFRLRRAAMNDEPVQEIDERHRDPYLEEARLGAGPLQQVVAECRS
jgi:hypothetical protein